ncbi:MAG: hypothetical protein ACRCV3_02640 [Desulfovibrionaceae bacterium]
MAYDIKLVKISTGDTVMGKYNADTNVIDSPAILQSIPTQEGVQMVLLPFGYPFEDSFSGEISYTHVLYEYKNIPDELRSKYTEAVSNITIASPSALSMSGSIPGLIK